MAIIFCEGFDGYCNSGSPISSSTSLSQIWDENWQQGSNSYLTAASGRNSTYGYVGGNTNNYIGKNLGVNYDTLIVGVAHMPAALNYSVLSLIDGSTTQVQVKINSTGQIEVYRGALTTLLGTTTLSYPISTSVHRYIECKVVFHASTGSVVIRVDGATELTLSSQNTAPSGNAYANRFRLLQHGSFDDLYIADTTGSIASDFIGDIRVQALMPSGNGNSSQWVGSDSNSTDNYLLVDEVGTTGANGDTDYVASSTAGQKDTYAFGNLTPTAGTVYAVQVQASARKDDAGSRSIVTVARLNSTEVDGPVQELATSYAYAWDVRETAPGGSQWTISDVNSAEFGVKVNA